MSINCVYIAAQWTCLSAPRFFHHVMLTHQLSKPLSFFLEAPSYKSNQEEKSRRCETSLTKVRCRIVNDSQYVTKEHLHSTGKHILQSALLSLLPLVYSLMEDSLRLFSTMIDAHTYGRCASWPIDVSKV